MFTYIYERTIIRKIFVVKNFLYSSMSTKIKNTKYFQRTYYVIERELNYRRVREFFNMNILHEYFSTRKFPELWYLLMNVHHLILTIDTFIITMLQLTPLLTIDVHLYLRKLKRGA